MRYFDYAISLQYHSLLSLPNTALASCPRARPPDAAVEGEDALASRFAEHVRRACPQVHHHKLIEKSASDHLVMGRMGRESHRGQ